LPSTLFTPPLGLIIWATIYIYISREREREREKRVMREF
jgi:hypothetical protein